MEAWLLDESWMRIELMARGVGLSRWTWWYKLIVLFFEAWTTSREMKWRSSDPLGGRRSSAQLSGKICKMCFELGMEIHLSEMTVEPVLYAEKTLETKQDANKRCSCGFDVIFRPQSWGSLHSAFSASGNGEVCDFHMITDTHGHRWFGGSDLGSQQCHHQRNFRQTTGKKSVKRMVSCKKIKKPHRPWCTLKDDLLIIICFSPRESVRRLLPCGVSWTMGFAAKCREVYGPQKFNWNISALPEAAETATLLLLVGRQGPT